MSTISCCPSCPQFTRFVRNHYPKIGSAALFTGTFAATLYDPSYVYVNAFGAIAIFATIAKHMRGPSPLQGRVVDPFAELPAEDRANPQNLIRVYERLKIPGKPQFPDATTPLEKALEIWKWLQRSEQQEFLLGFRGRFDLQNAGLTALPSVIGLFRNITELNLKYNELTALPPEIGGLTALTKLDLCCNQLAALPPEIGRLTALTELDLSCNQLAALPPEIGRLTALTELSLSCNQLAALPPEIGGLTALTELDLSRNQLEALPLEIGELTALTKLDLSRNQLEALPLEIGELTALTKLSFSYNQLAALPPEIGRLTALTKLDLSGNQLAALPPEIGRLTALTELSLSYNQLEAFPPEIGMLTALTKLDLSDNQLAALPPEIGGLTALTELILSGNQLAALPPEIGGLTALTKLSLSGNQLAALLPEIGGLTALTWLDLSDNQLEALPPEIGGLTALTWLDLSGNQLEALPPALRINGFGHTPQPPTPTLEENLRSSEQAFTDAFPALIPENAQYYEGDRVCDFRELLSLDPDNLDRFSKFFPRIPEIADYAQGTPETQKNVILRADRMVQLACKSPEFRQEMLQILEAGENGCGRNRRPACADRILTLFNEIEIAWQFHHKKLSHEECRELALREGRYKWIEEIGRTMAKNHNNSDEELETILRLQLELKDEFNLPITSTSMLFPGLSRVTKDMIEEAKKELRGISSNELLTKSEHWLKHQAEQYPEEVERIQGEYAHLDAIAGEYYSTDDEQTKAKILEENPRLKTLLEALAIKYDAALSNAIMKARLEAIAGIGEKASNSKAFESKVQG